MNRLDHHSQRLNNILFAVMLTAAASAGWIVAAGTRYLATEPAIVELERVVVIGHREAAPQAAAAQTVAPTFELPRVVVTGKRIDQEALARAASRERNA